MNWVKELTDTEIDFKHIKLRGSLKLKYPGEDKRCFNLCIDTTHRCFLVDRHEGACEFSSECERGEPVKERDTQ